MKKRILICTLVFTLILSAFTSCGAGKAEADQLIAYDKMASTESPMEWYEPEYGYNGKYATKGESIDSSAEIILDSATGTEIENYSEKIIKNINISAQTKDYEKALDGILSAVNQYGGYKESVTSSGKSYYAGDYYTRTARMTLRIPSENLDKFLGDVGGLINVTSQSSNQSNVTAAYYDTKARLEVLETERVAYDEMLKMAKSVEEVLQIKDRLYRTIEEIEANKTQLKIYDNKVSFSTVHLTLDEVKEYVEVPTPKTSFGDRIANAFKDSWIAFANGFQNFVVWFISAIPTLLVLAVFIGGGIAVGVVIFKKAKKAKKNDGE